MNKTATLVLHIGIGKTGSTSIQSALAKSKQDLLSNSVQYWGLNLESVETPQSEFFPWQQKAGTTHLLRLGKAQAIHQVDSALRKALVFLPANGTAIWSNEGLYEQPEVIIPVLEKLIDEHSVTIRVIACVRSLSSWLPSAYRQWGVRHKTLRGRVPSFLTWAAERQSLLRYGSKLAIWDKRIGSKLELINFDSSEDIASAFLHRLDCWPGGCPKVESTHAYATPGAAQLALWALVNNQRDEPTAPTAIQRLLQSSGLLQRKYHRFQFDRIEVNKESIRILQSLLADDQRLVNQMLTQRGEPVLNSHDNSREEEPVADASQIIALLADLLISQHQRIESLEKIIRRRSDP